MDGYISFTRYANSWILLKKEEEEEEEEEEKRGNPSTPIGSSKSSKSPEDTQKGSSSSSSSSSSMLVEDARLVWLFPCFISLLSLSVCTFWAWKEREGRSEEEVDSND